MLNMDTPLEFIALMYRWSPFPILSTFTRPAVEFIANPIGGVMQIQAGKDIADREVVACCFTDILHSCSLILGYDVLPFVLIYLGIICLTTTPAGR